MVTRVLTSDERVQLEALAQYLTQDQIADYLGISRPTLAAILDRDEEAALRYKRGKARAIGAVASNLIDKARKGDTACMIFFLKTQAGWRETNRTEITGADGGAVKITQEMTDDLRQALDVLAAKIADSDSADQVALPGPAQPDHA
jgi:transcriptional regulator with XRE-family HTH domain